MSISRIELAILKNDARQAFDSIAAIDGVLGIVVAAEVAARAHGNSSEALKSKTAAALENVVPGLSAAIASIKTNSNVGVEVDALRVKAAAVLDQATDDYLRGLVLETLMIHNRVAEASAMALSAEGEVVSRSGLRWNFSAAKTLLARNEPEKALAALDKFIAQIPEGRVPFMHLRGLVLRQLGRMEDAGESLLDCITHDVDYLTPIFALQFIVRNGICVERCIEVISAAQALRPREHMFPSLLAEAYIAKGDSAKAISLLVEATRLQTVDRRPGLAKVEWPSEPIKKPDFIIIGTPKSGTTSAYAYMRAHPKVLPAIVKEVAFFSDNDKYKQGIGLYLANFPSLAGRDGFVTGEASPEYFYSVSARKRIAEHFPDSRLILFLRNPAVRAISGYYQRKKMNGNIPEITEYFDSQFALCANKSAKDVAHGHSVLSGGVYYPTVYQWQHAFSEGALLILRAEDLFEKPEEVMASIFAHIGVEPHKQAKYPIANKGLYPAAPAELIQRLEDFYRPHNKVLYKMIGRDMGW